MKVVFYVLPSNAVEERLLLACQLIHQVYAKKQRILVVANPQMGFELNQLLWTNRASNFMPHKYMSLDLTDNTHHYPVIISERLLSTLSFDVFMNLKDCPLEIENNNPLQLIEIVTQETKVLNATRSHYLHYKRKGYLLSTIPM